MLGGGGRGRELADIESTEKELVEDGRRIALLQESLQQTSQLCGDMVKQLDQFEERVAQLEPTVMPLHRSLSIIARVHSNVQATLDVVRLLAENSELARREEAVLSNGPTTENLEGYLASIERVQAGIGELHGANLAFCHLTIRQLESINSIAVDALGTKYRELLSEYSFPVDLSEPVAVAGEIEMPEAVAGKLRQIAVFAQTSPETLSQILGYYGEVRANYMMKSLQGLFQSAGGSVRGAYQRGSHPFILAVREFFKMAQREETSFSPRILPAAAAPDATRRAIKHPADLVRMSAEALGAKVSKAAGRREFVDQIWVFDVIEAFNDAYATCPSQTIQALLAPALKSVTAGGVDVLKDLLDDIQGTSRSAATAAVSENATVFEQTSTLLNCLRRMLEYERVVEALLHRWSQPEWDGIVGAVDAHAQPQVPAMALYYQDLLRGLEVSIEKYSHGYKRPINSVLFQLNNYNHILRTFKTSTLAAMLTTESEQKYDSIVSALVKDYLASWEHVANLVREGTSRSGPLAPRERLKLFSTELDELVKGQERCAVPDVELRAALISKVRLILSVPFVSFYNMNQPLFVAMQAKIKLDPDAIDSLAARLFQA